jgi:hypothetical protein
MYYRITHGHPQIKAQTDVDTDLICKKNFEEDSNQKGVRLLGVFPKER